MAQTPELREGSKLVSPSSKRTYVVLSNCGHGAFGTVFKCKASDSQNLFALKVVDTLHAKDQLDLILGEISVTQKAYSLSNNRCPRTHEAFVIQPPSKGKNRQLIVIVMDFIDGITLSDLIVRDKPLCETLCLLILFEVASGLKGMHSEGLIHRDIKSSNILLSRSGDVFICDFGVSKVLSSCKPSTSTISGTPFWMAPEIINGKEYNESVDIYSLGVTAVELVTGQPPMPSAAAVIENTHDVMNKLRRQTTQKIHLLDKRKFSKAFRDIVEGCLAMDPHQRMSAASLVDSISKCFYSNTSPIPSSAGSGSISSLKSIVSLNSGSFNLKHALGELVKLTSP